MEETQMNFEPVKLFRGRMEVLLPENLKDMPDYLAKRKYPSKHRPPVILMNEDNTVNYSFHLMETPLPQSQIEKAMAGMVKGLRKAMPQAKFEEVQYEEGQEGKIAWAAYENEVMDGRLFYIVFVTSLDGKLLYGAFNCPVEMREEWEKYALYSMKSIKKTGGNEE